MQVKCNTMILLDYVPMYFIFILMLFKNKYKNKEALINFHKTNYKLNTNYYKI